MSKVVPLNARQHRQPRDLRLAGHAALFAEGRRGQDDVFWLKENAEFLNISECTGQPGLPILPAYGAVYETIADRLGSYPQYYRFLLSICLDLEDLGQRGETGEALCDWVAAQGLPQAELSDLQRAEAQRLLARRGHDAPDDGLRERLHAFVNRPATFAVPNKKAAYELTHIVFYLSEYGRRDPQVGPRTIESLTFAGLCAYLDQNADLLAEICVALRYAGAEPSPVWEGMVLSALKGTDAEAGPGPAVQDDYHAYLVSGWLGALCGRPAFPAILPGGAGAAFRMPVPQARPLLALARGIEAHRCSDWDRMRRVLSSECGEADRRLLDAAEASTSAFGAFFEGFARAARPGRG